MNNEKEYFAFISYKREDEKWAKWLQHKLEHYKLPSNLNGRTDLPKEIRPIFRDQSELAAGVLADEINKALINSKYLIVICSPRAAQSVWVGKEVQTFIDLGRTDKIIPFIIGGMAHAQNPEEECFPLALLNLPPDQELLGINIDEMGRDAAAVKVVAQMFGLKFDALWQRYERENRRRRVFIIVAALLLASTGVGIAVWFSVLNSKISEQNERITTQRDEIIMQNEDIQKKNESLLNDSIIMAAQMDSIKTRDAYIVEQQDSIAQTNVQLNLERDNLKKTNWQMMENQARFVSEKILSEVANGNLYTAQKLSLCILPKDVKNPERPCTAQAEIALRKSLMPMRWKGYKQVSFLRGWDVNYGVDNFDVNADNICFFSKKGDYFLHNLCTDEENKLPGHGLDVDRLGFNIDGTKCFAEDNYSVTIWDVKSRNALACVYYYDLENVNETEAFDSIMFSNSFIFKQEGKEESVRIISDVINKREEEYMITTRDTLSVVIEGRMSDDSMFFVDNRGRVYTRFELKNDYEIKQLFFDGCICASSFSSDNSYLALGDINGVISIVNPQTGRVINRIKGHDEEITILEFTNDKRNYLVSASTDSIVKVWDINRAKCVATIVTKYDKIVSLKVSPLTSKLAIVSHNENRTPPSCSIQLWSMSGSLLKTKEMDDLPWWVSGINPLAFSPKEDCVILPYDEDSFVIWDFERNEVITKNARERYSLGNAEEYLLNIQFDNKGKYYICTVGQGQHFVLEVENDQQLFSFESCEFEESEIYHLWIYIVNSLVTKENHLFTISSGGVIREYDVNSGLILQTIRLSDFYEINHCHHDFYYGVFSSDGRYVFVTQSNEEVSCYYIVGIPDLQTIINETNERLKNRVFKSWEKRLYYLE